MIQRIQSIFLLLASGAFFGEFVFPFATSDVAGSGYLSDNTYNVLDHPVLLVLTIVGGITAAAAIFLYRNRSLQMRLTILTIVWSILLPAVACLLVLTEPSTSGDIARYEEHIGIVLPVVALVCAVLANRAIKKDDQLVRSMDRLR